MIVRIQSIHFDASEQLQAFIQKKAAKLEKFYDDIEKVEVSLKVVKPETAENKEAGVKVLVPNGELYANKVCDTFEEAVDLCLEALENSWLNTRKNNEVNKNPLKILRDKNKCLNLQPFRLAVERCGCIFKKIASLAQLARARDL